MLGSHGSADFWPTSQGQLVHELRTANVNDPQIHTFVNHGTGFVSGQVP